MLERTGYMIGSFVPAGAVLTIAATEGSRPVARALACSRGALRVVGVEVFVGCIRLVIAGQQALGHKVLPVVVAHDRHELGSMRRQVSHGRGPHREVLRGIQVVAVIGARRRTHAMA